MKRNSPLLVVVALFCVVGVAGVVGCTSLNDRLNKSSVPPEARKKNQTRAALAAEPPAIAAQADQRIAPATRPTTSAASTTGPHARDDGFFVGIAISGGGSRSANFSAACMFQLHRLGILQRADYLSAVSGGTLSAAYYCISDDQQWNPGNVQRKLAHSFASDLIWNTVLPWNFAALMLSDWDRSDLLGDSFQKTLFSRNGKGLTFGDLRADRPRLLLNATDLQTGKSFVFCNETFDQINSDLSAYPLGQACAASSAVPVLLHQVTLRDYNTAFKQYRHLIDGGVVDNLGVRTLVETYSAHLRGGNESAYPRGAVFIVIDARTQYDARISGRGDTTLLESFYFGAGITSTVLINRASSATLAEMILDSAPDGVDAKTLRKEREDLIEGGYVRLENIHGRPVYVLHLALSRVNELADLPFKTFSETVNSISTYFNIKPTEAHHLYQAAELLVKQRYKKQLESIAEELNRQP
ncbi:MAG: patatin-like phospholipase family protein [Tepidisphaeraceae bacterium]